MLHPALQAEVIQSAQSITDWLPVIRQAEVHSLSPLLYYHLTAAGVNLPTPVKRELLGASMQFTRTNEIRGTALAEITATLEKHGIRALALKGAALAHLVYPRPGLRPMRDMDILVSPTDLNQTRALMLDLGYLPEQDAVIPTDHHHLPPLARAQQGVHISIEIHHHLFPSTRHYQPLGYRELISSATSFQLHDQTVYTLGLEDTLWHIYRHAAGPPLLTTPLKLIYVADIVGLVEKFADRIDWDKLNHHYPQVMRILPLLHFLTPWSPELLARFDWELTSPPQGTGEEYRGWPRFPWHGGKNLQATFHPPAWWVRFFYGIGVGAPFSYTWHRWVRHPFHIFEWGVSLALAALRQRG